MLLLTEEEGVTDDVLFKVTREKNLNLAGGHDMAGSEIWKAFPGSEWAGSHKIAVLVDT